MEIFDNEANTYDSWYESKLGSFVDTVETELAFTLFKPQEGMKILDVGCGTGNFSIKLAEMGCQVVGIDISEKMLAEARKKIEGRNLDIKFYNMDVYNIDFQDGYFDGVFSMAAFEFIDRPQEAYDEMYRVLKEQGHLLIGTINLDSRWGQLYLSKSFQENTIFRYAKFKTMSDLQSLNVNEIMNSGQCLFISPNAKDEEIGMEVERSLSKSEKGGFICVLWKKKR
ncbi:MAG: methyltransferase domain-containing protein [Tissierellaceae bacterium]